MQTISSVNSEEIWLEITAQGPSFRQTEKRPWQSFVYSFWLLFQIHIEHLKFRFVRPLISLFLEF